MAQVTVQSKLVIELCEKAIEEENSEFNNMLPTWEATQEHLDRCDLIAANFGIPIQRIYPLDNFKMRHYKVLLKLESIRNLASLAESIVINDEDLALLSIENKEEKQT